MKYQSIQKRKDILWIFIVLTMIFHPTSHFLERWKKDKTLVRGGKYCELNPENSELVEGQIMTYSENKG